MNKIQNMQKILDFFFPPLCLACQKEGKYMCRGCKKQIRTHPEICFLCHKKSPGYATCMKCKDSSYLEGVIICFGYSGVIKNIIHHLKWHHHYHLGEYISKKVALHLQTHSHLREYLNQPSTALSYIPTHWWKQHIIRGYNQSKVLATSLAQHLNMETIILTQKKVYTRSQTKFTRIQRKQNIYNTFSLIHNVSAQNIHHLLLVDDVMTTGATLQANAKKIKQKYPHIQIRGCCLARHIG